MNEKLNKKSEYDWLEQHDKHMKNWRAWGSWFSWGSPVGLGLFFVSIAGALWILSQAFGWK